MQSNLQFFFSIAHEKILTFLCRISKASLRQTNIIFCCVRGRWLQCQTFCTTFVIIRDPATPAHTPLCSNPLLCVTVHVWRVHSPLLWKQVNCAQGSGEKCARTQRRFTSFLFCKSCRWVRSLNRHLLFRRTQTSAFKLSSAAWSTPTCQEITAEMLHFVPFKSVAKMPLAPRSSSSCAKTKASLSAWTPLNHPLFNSKVTWQTSSWYSSYFGRTRQFKVLDEPASDHLILTHQLQVAL